MMMWIQKHLFRILIKNINCNNLTVDGPHLGQAPGSKPGYRLIFYDVKQKY